MIDSRWKSRGNDDDDAGQHDLLDTLVTHLLSRLKKKKKSGKNRIIEKSSSQQPSNSEKFD
jgi:hypothetical protein